MEDLTREERRALAMKKAQARRSNVQIGQRKVHLKIKKAAKSVQGDIDAAKKRLGKSLPVLLPGLPPTSRTHIHFYLFIFCFFIATHLCACATTTLGPSQQRIFETANIWKRKAQASKRPGTKTDAERVSPTPKQPASGPVQGKGGEKLGVVDTLVWANGERKPVRGRFRHEARSRCCRTYPPKRVSKGQGGARAMAQRVHGFLPKLGYPLRKCFPITVVISCHNGQRRSTLTSSKITKWATISDWMIFVNDFELMLGRHKDPSLACSLLQFKLGGGIATWVRGAARKLYRSRVAA